MRDLFNHITPKPVIVPAAAGTDNTAMVGAIIDKRGYESLTYIIETGINTDVDATFAALLEESDDSGMAGATTVAAADLLGTLALAGFLFSDDSKCFKLGYIGPKRYTRLTITPAGNNSGNIFVTAVAILAHPSLQATANPPA